MIDFSKMTPELVEASRQIFPDEEFVKAAEACLAYTKTQAVGVRQFQPIVIVPGRKRGLTHKDPIELRKFVMSFPETAKQRGLLLHQTAVRLVRRDFDPCGVIVASEAWTSTGVFPASTTAQDLLRGPRVLPSQDPNREECIYIGGLTLDGRQVAKHLKPLRDDKEIIRGLLAERMPGLDDERPTPENVQTFNVVPVSTEGRRAMLLQQYFIMGIFAQMRERVKAREGSK